MNLLEHVAVYTGVFSRCCCYYHGNEADVIVQLLNGCMLLVTTLPLLIQLLKANHFKLTELQILVGATILNVFYCSYFPYRWLMNVIRC